MVRSDFVVADGKLNSDADSSESESDKSASDSESSSDSHSSQSASETEAPKPKRGVRGRGAGVRVHAKCIRTGRPRRRAYKRKIFAKPQQRNFEFKGIIYRNTALKIFLDLSEHEEKVAASGAGVQKLNVQL